MSGVESTMCNAVVVDEWDADVVRRIGNCELASERTIAVLLVIIPSNDRSATTPPPKPALEVSFVRLWNFSVK